MNQVSRELIQGLPVLLGLMAISVTLGFLIHKKILPKWSFPVFFGAFLIGAVIYNFYVQHKQIKGISSFKICRVEERTTGHIQLYDCRGKTPLSHLRFHRSDSLMVGDSVSKSAGLRVYVYRRKDDGNFYFKKILYPNLPVHIEILEQRVRTSEY
jgi:hypothetical protein